MLKEQARNTKDIVGEDNKLLAEMGKSWDPFWICEKN